MRAFLDIDHILVEAELAEGLVTFLVALARSSVVKSLLLLSDFNIYH